MKWLHPKSIKIGAIYLFIFVKYAYSLQEIINGEESIALNLSPLSLISTLVQSHSESQGNGFERWTSHFIDKRENLLTMRYGRALRGQEDEEEEETDEKEDTVEEEGEETQEGEEERQADEPQVPVVLSFTKVGSHTWMAPPHVNSVQVLVVAGGGGAGYDSGGGGGGGGVIYVDNFAVQPGVVYPIFVGAGGVPASSREANAMQGGYSVFGTLTAVGGGGGMDSASNGGNAGSNLHGEGNNANAGGGGAGAGAKGGAAADGKGGDGGVGVSCSITGTATLYGGGGGGGSYTGVGGKGGGGGGGTGGGVEVAIGISGFAGTGGGGGGNGAASPDSPSGTGGSGIVIIAFPPPPPPDSKEARALVGGEVGAVSFQGYNKRRLGLGALGLGAVVLILYFVYADGKGKEETHLL